MNTGSVNIIMLLAAVWVLSACSATAVQRVAGNADRPILSVAEVATMIRVEVKTLEPTASEEAVVAAAD